MATSLRDDWGRIDQLYVDPEHVGQGIGTHLLSAALDSLPKPIRLYSFQRNAGAQRFYGRFGVRPRALSDGGNHLGPGCCRAKSAWEVFEDECIGMIAGTR
jgi:GNAT superfamily N-acetyltransferase